MNSVNRARPVAQPVPIFCGFCGRPANVIDEGSLSCDCDAVTAIGRRTSRSTIRRCQCCRSLALRRHFAA